MTKEELRQIRHLRKEIALLRGQIEELKSVVVTDKVTGSMDEHPYIKREFVVKGLADENRAKVQRLQKRLERRVDDLFEMVIEINAFVEEIDDSLLRQVIILRHVNGLSWEQVAAHIGGGTTWNSLRMMHDRFLEGK